MSAQSAGHAANRAAHRKKSVQQRFSAYNDFTLIHRKYAMRRFTLALAALSIAAAAQADDQVRSAPAFTSISVQGPISITVDAGKAQSLTVRGDARFITDLTSEVVNGELRLRLRDKNAKSWHGDPRVLITMPALRAVDVEGAGEVRLNQIRGERLDVN